MADHDGIYKRLFSHPGLVAQLLREFVAESWLDDFDLDGMERQNTNFNADTGEERRSDVIWRLPLRGGGDAYLLLMIEFQSTPDRWMALRALTYAGLLWQWQPKMRYNIIDEGVYSEADLAARDTLVALLFRLENCRDPDRVLVIIDDVIEWLRLHPAYDSLRPVFAALAWRLVELEDRSSSGAQVSENLLEVRTMLATRASEWKQQWLAEGKAEGEAKGKAEALTRLLESRFGPTPEPVSSRIAAAGIDELGRLFDRALVATTLDAVFDETKPH